MNAPVGALRMSSPNAEPRLAVEHVEDFLLVRVHVSGGPSPAATSVSKAKNAPPVSVPCTLKVTEPPSWCGKRVPCARLEHARIRHAPTLPRVPATGRGVDSAPWPSRRTQPTTSQNGHSTGSDDPRREPGDRRDDRPRARHERGGGRGARRARARGAARLGGARASRARKAVMLEARKWLIDNRDRDDRDDRRRDRQDVRGRAARRGLLLRRLARLLGQEAPRSTWPTSACKTHTPLAARQEADRALPPVRRDRRDRPVELPARRTTSATASRRSWPATPSSSSRARSRRSRRS